MRLIAVLSLTLLPGSVSGVQAQEAFSNRAKALNDLGAAYFERAQYAAAESAFASATALWGASRPGSDSQLACGLLNLAAVLRAEARYPEAERTYLEALDIRQKLVPESEADVATVLHGLALLYNDTGRNIEAERTARQALALRRRALGPATATAATLDALGLILQSENRAPEAVPLFREALDINEHVAPRNEISVAGSLVHLGVIHRVQGDLPAARAYLERAVAVYLRIRPEHPATAEALNSLAQVLRAQRDFRQARADCERALDIWRRTVGVEHPDYAAGLTNLGLIYQSAKESGLARDSWERALRIDQNRFTPDHPRLATDLNNLGAVSVTLHDNAAAESYFLRAIRNSGAQPGQGAALAMANLAALYKRQHREEEASDLLGRAAAILAGADTGDPRVAAILDGYARLLRARGSYAEAADAETKAMRVRVRNALRSHDSADGW